MKDLKPNFDTQPDKETISPDKNCSICYGRGIMQANHPTRPRAFYEKECSCITIQRVHQAREENFAIYRAA